MTLRRFMAGTRLAVDGMIAQLPPDDPERHRLGTHAAKLNRACGCGSGAFALIAALSSASAYIAIHRDFSLRTIGLSFLLVLAAALLGKATGLLAAALRLELLRWSLERRGPSRRRVGHVDVH